MTYINAANTSDLIVPRQNDSGILEVALVTRQHEPYEGWLALPGGYNNCGEKSLEETGVRELSEETGLKTTCADLRLVAVYSDPKRDLNTL